jgi:hypothetical protein
MTGYRRDLILQGRGAEGASPGDVGTKLSGKRTVTWINPGKIQVYKLEHRRGQIPVVTGIISQVNRQEEGTESEFSPPFYF